MTFSEYLTALNDLEIKLCNDYKFDRSIAKKIASKAYIENEYEAEQYAYELADLVADCIKLASNV